MLIFNITLILDIYSSNVSFSSFVMNLVFTVIFVVNNWFMLLFICVIIVILRESGMQRFVAMFKCTARN